MIPTDFNHEHLQSVSSFSDLILTEFEGKRNAVCWERNLEGDFQEIVSKLILKENITEVTKEDLWTLELSEQGEKARAIILEDLELLTKYGAQPSLNLLKSYERDDEFSFISTDVYSFHVDRAPFQSPTFLCTYFGAASDILPNDQAVQKIQIPEVREQLRKIYTGAEAGFEDFLKENFFDLHYEALANAQPINLGNGHLWKLAVDDPEAPTLPCIHRAPTEHNEYRLLLIC